MDGLLSPRISQAVSAADQPPLGQDIFKSGSFEECVHWLISKSPSSKFVEETTFFLFGYRSFASSAELLSLIAVLAENNTPGSRLWEFVHIWVKILPDREFGLLQKMLELKNMPQSVSNDIKLVLLRKNKQMSLGHLPMAEGTAKVLFTENKQ
jgi:hypothetical protein